MAWNLGFISEEDFKKHVRATIMKYGEKLESYDLKRFNSNLIDPIKLIFDKSVYRTSWEEIVNNEIFRQRDKSNNNDIGYFHQNIFSYFKGCEVPQAGWDVIYRNPDGIQMPDGDIVHTIYVEMKNKHNTMNSASSAKTYIKMQGQILEDDDCACLLVEAIAKKSQNIKWSTKVDGKNVQHRLIRRGEARTACTYNEIPLDHVHFLDLPFYESGKIEKLPMTEKDVETVRALLQKVQPHQIYVAGDLADPHGTHKKCTDAVLAAIDEEKNAGAEWLKDCRIWMYRGAWAEWEIENIEMCVPLSPEELRAKRNSILKHQSQMESAPFLGNDERLFWQRAEDRNRATASLYDQLGLACYEAMEAFVEYKPL